MDEIPAGVGEYIARLQPVLVNGAVAFASFELSGSPGFDWLVACSRWKELRFFEKFFDQAEVRARLSDVTSDARIGEDTFEWRTSLTLDGELAHTLLVGGAYRQFVGGASFAKKLGAEFCRSLFDDRFLEVEVFHSSEPWSAWFYDVAWDHTWVVIDKRLQRVSVLCSTDTD